MLIALYVIQILFSSYERTQILIKSFVSVKFYRNVNSQENTYLKRNENVDTTTLNFDTIIPLDTKNKLM